MEKQPVGNFLTTGSTMPVLDVRSPSEYMSGHVPGARSFPLFSDEERAVIGTLYKQEGKGVAIKKGLEIVGPKMVGFVEVAEAFGVPALALYCWRGGMRSESMAWLLERYGISTVVLKGGYKAYRNHMLDFFRQQLPLRVISGYTGSKKTMLLHMLKECGEQVIDLEGLAHHQGSSFGNKKSESQPTSEHFQNTLFEAFRKLDLRKPIWIEDESIRIGKVNLPEHLYKHMNESPHILLDIDKSERVNYLVQDYGSIPKEKLIEATDQIRKKLGSERTTEAIQLITDGNLGAAAEIILTYYDVWYEKSLSKKQHLIRQRFSVGMDDLPEVALKLSRQQTHAV